MIKIPPMLGVLSFFLSKNSSGMRPSCLDGAAVFNFFNNLTANGERRSTIRKAVKGEISEEVPASFLRKHKDVTLIIDKSAAGKLK